MHLVFFFDLMKTVMNMFFLQIFDTLNDQIQ